MKVSGYKDMLEQAKRSKCIAFVEFGSYQGEWLGVLDKGDILEIWKGSYGSCSGCDFLQSYANWENTYPYIEIPDEDVYKEIGDEPFFELDKSLFKTISLKEFEQILPANIRYEIYDFKPIELFNEIKNALN